MSNVPTHIIDPKGDDGYVDPDGNYLGDDNGSGDDEKHETRVITKEKWDDFQKDPKYFKDGNWTEEGRKMLRNQDRTNSVPLTEYMVGIKISDETWEKLTANGGTKLTPFVTNNSKATIFYKPEGNNINFGTKYSNNEAYPLGEGLSLYVDVDGVTTSKYSASRVGFANSMVYKKVDGMKIIVNSDGSIAIHPNSRISSSKYSEWKGRDWLEDLHDDGDSFNPFDWRDDFSWDALFFAAYMKQKQPYK